MSNALRSADATYARSGWHRDAVRRATARVALALETIERPYVAFSGGKDSLVVMALALDADPTVPVVWADDELELPGSEAYIPHVVGGLGGTLTIVQGWAQHAGWFDPWRNPPFWREPLPDMRWIGQRMEPWSRDVGGYDGVLLGLRHDESHGRRIGGKRFHAGAIGGAIAPPHWSKRTRQHTSWPISDWRLEDVWAFIAERELDYHPAYDVMTAVGVAREKQRVGPMPLADGWALRDCWPDTFRELVSRYGDRWR